MSGHIPFELLEEIIKRLPVRSLIQCRSVSKALKSLIDGSEFIAAHRLRHTKPERLLLRYEDRVGTQKHYVSFVDDHTFPQNKAAPMGTPMFVDLLSGSRLIGTSLGLFCFYGNHIERGHMAVLWNPSIRKSVAIPVPDNLFAPYEPILGFGVCPDTRDPKIVSITDFSIYRRPHKVEVYTLSSGIWRPLSGNLPRHLVKFRRAQVLVDGFIYWLALELIAIDGGVQLRNLIMSFDMINENFREVQLPDSLATRHPVTLTVCGLRDSLAILNYGKSAKKEVCDVWIMDHDIQNSFTKLFTIQAPHQGMNTVGFRKNGEPIMVMRDHNEDVFEDVMEMEYDSENFFESVPELEDYYVDLYEPNGPRVLVVYEPNSERIIHLGIGVKACSFFVQSYMETLLLLDRSG